MKKRIKTKQLGRDRQARKALFKNLVASFIRQGEVQTTAAKAKAVRSIIEKLISKGRDGSLHARRQIQSFIQDKSLVKELVDEISPRFKDIQGGYTKLKIIGNRKGDNAPIVKLSLTRQKDETKSPQKSAKSPKHSTESKPPQAEPVPASAPATPKKLAPVQASTKPAHSSSRTGVRQGER